MQCLAPRENLSPGYCQRHTVSRTEPPAAWVARVPSTRAEPSALARCSHPEWGDIPACFGWGPPWGKVSNGGFSREDSLEVPLPAGSLLFLSLTPGGCGILSSRSSGQRAMWFLPTILSLRPYTVPQAPCCLLQPLSPAYLLSWSSLQDWAVWEKKQRAPPQQQSGISGTNMVCRVSFPMARAVPAKAQHHSPKKGEATELSRSTVVSLGFVWVS